MTDTTPAPLPRLSVGVLAGLVLAVLVVIVVTLNRGFDFSDEGFVLSMAASNRGAAGEFWGFQHLVHPLYELFGGSILAFRITRLLGYLALGVILTVIAHRTLGALGVTLSRPGWVIVALLAQLGTMAAWSSPPRYLGYNELSAWFAQLGGALMLLLLARTAGAQRERGRFSQFAPWVGLGAMLSLLFFAKITAAVVFGVFLVAVLVIAHRPLGALKRTLAVVAGTIGALLVLLVIGVPVADYVARIVGVIVDPSTQEESGYSLVPILIAYVGSVASTSSGLVLATLLLVVVIIAVRLGLRPAGHAPETAADDRTALLRRGAIAVAVILCIVIVSPKELTVWDGLGSDMALLLIVAVVALVAIGPRVFALDTGVRRRTAIVVLGVLVLIATPFVNAVGTLNGILGQTVFSATLWAVAAGVGIVLLWERSAATGILRLVPIGIAVALVANGAVAVAGDVLKHPYRTDPYLTQKSSVRVPEFAGMRVSESDAGLIEWLAETAKREDAADVATTSMGSAGALWIFNNSTWASPWMGAFSGPSLTRSCLADEPKQLLLLQPGPEVAGSGPYEAVVSGLADCGIDFPADFTAVSEYSDDDPQRSVTLWRYERD